MPSERRIIKPLVGVALCVAMLVVTSSAIAQGWGRAFSEEDGSNKAAASCPGGVDGMRCSGKYCDDISLHCKGGVIGSSGLSDDGSPIDWVSEDTHSNEAKCEGNSVVTGMACRGRYCDELSLYCNSTTNLKITDCQWTDEISEESGGSKINQILQSNRYLVGVRCEGSYCDRKQLLMCKGESQKITAADVKNTPSWIVGCQRQHRCRNSFKKAITTDNSTKEAWENEFRSSVAVSIEAGLEIPLVASTTVTTETAVESTRKQIAEQVRNQSFGTEDTCFIDVDMEKYGIETVWRYAVTSRVLDQTFVIKTCQITCTGDGKMPKYLDPADDRLVGSCTTYYKGKRPKAAAPAPQSAPPRPQTASVSAPAASQVTPVSTVANKSPIPSRNQATISNKWQETLFINVEDYFDATEIEPDWTSAKWTFQANGDGSYVIINEATAEALCYADGSLTLEVETNAEGTRWILDPVGDGSVRILAASDPSIGLNIEHGVLDATPYEPGWWSAMWYVQ